MGGDRGLRRIDPATLHRSAEASHVVLNDAACPDVRDSGPYRIKDLPRIRSGFLRLRGSPPLHGVEFRAPAHSTPLSFTLTSRAISRFVFAMPRSYHQILAANANASLTSATDLRARITRAREPPS